MLRYYLVATLLVAIGMLLLTQLFHRGGVALEIASVRASVPPKPGEGERLLGTPRPLAGEAPWALSALPECFKQISEVSGPRAFVDARMPPARVLLAPGSTVRAEDCTLVVGAGNGIVTRGTDRLTIPQSAFYRIGSGFAVYHADGRFAEFRRYRVK